MPSLSVTPGFPSLLDGRWHHLLDGETRGLVQGDGRSKMRSADFAVTHEKPPLTIRVSVFPMP